MADDQNPDAPARPGSRAVLRQIVPGVNEPCAHCSQRISFRARQRSRWVIANVYKRRRWNRVEIDLARAP